MISTVLEYYAREGCQGTAKGVLRFSAVVGGGMEHPEGIHAIPRARRPFVILNPVAGKGRALRVWPAIRPLLRAGGFDWDEVIAERPMHAWNLAQDAADRGHDLIVSVGGDGTTHEVVNGLLRGRQGSPPRLAVIPVGTANDFPRAVAVPLDPIAAARLLLKGVGRRIDLGQVNERYFTTISGVGFDAEVADLVNHWPRWVRGSPVYVAGILRMLVTYRLAEAHITIDGAEQTSRILLLAAGNSGRYGGGIYMAPHARIDDGLLAIVLAKDLSKLETLAVLPKVFSGKHLSHPKVFHTNARLVHVTSAAHLAIHADGESVGHVPATFRAVPLALEVVVPGGD